MLDISKGGMNMSSNNTQLLTTHIFASKNDLWYGFEEMLKKLDEADIIVKLYKHEDSLLECRTITTIYLI